MVINGESWGIYTNVQQFNKEFLAENYASAKGSRWKVSGSPMGRGGLDYAGDDRAAYERSYELKTDDPDRAWPALIKLCKTINETPPDKLEAALAPMLDIDGALKFLALDVAVVNEDGYWVRASDYSLFLDTEGRFHLVPHDMNETFHNGRGPGMDGPGGGPGMGGPGGGPRGRGGEGRPAPGGENGNPPGGSRLPGGGDGFGQPGNPPQGFGPPEGVPQGFGPPRGGMGPGGGRGGMGGSMGPNLDPLVNTDNPRMALRQKLLAVPELRQRYLRYVHDIAEQSLDWQRLGPFVRGYASLIETEVQADTRKLGTTAGFRTAVGLDSQNPGGAAGRGGESLEAFIKQRRDYLLNNADVKSAVGGGKSP